jgi:hypothetical protein
VYRYHSIHIVCLKNNLLFISSSADCFVSLKKTATIAACPFCGQKSLTITYTEKIGKGHPHPNFNTDSKLKSPSHAPVTSSPPSMPKSTYTTPEQERKLRSMSLDETSPAASSSREFCVILCSFSLLCLYLIVSPVLGLLMLSCLASDFCDH